MTTGEKIREARRKRGLTQAQAAAMAETAQETWSNWERGRASPTLRMLARVAAALGVAACDLVGEE